MAKFPWTSVALFLLCAVTTVAQPPMPGEGGGLTTADEAQLRRFADSNWHEVTILAGSRTYYLLKGPTSIAYQITQGGVPVTEGTVEIAKLLAAAQEKRAGQTKPLLQDASGGTVHPLQAWRYELVQFPDGRTIVDRVQYDYDELQQIKALDIAFYELRYLQLVPPEGVEIVDEEALPTTAGVTAAAAGFGGFEAPPPQRPVVEDEFGDAVFGGFGDEGMYGEQQMPTIRFTARDYAEWHYALNQLMLWEYYCQRILGTDEVSSQLPWVQAYQDMTANALSGGDTPRRSSVDRDSLDGGRGGGARRSQRDGTSTEEIAAALQAEIARTPETYEGLWDYYNKQRDAVMKTELDLLLYMYSKITSREEEYRRIVEILEQKMDSVRRFARDWARKDQGDWVEVGNVTYLRTDEGVDFVPGDTVNVVAPRLSPFDFVTEDGSVRTVRDLKVERGIIEQ